MDQSLRSLTPLYVPNHLTTDNSETGRHATRAAVAGSSDEAGTIDELAIGATRAIEGILSADPGDGPAARESQIRDALAQWIGHAVRREVATTGAAWVGGRERERPRHRPGAFETILAHAARDRRCSAGFQKPGVILAQGARQAVPVSHG